MIQKSTGWILDFYIEDNEAIMWIKTEDGKVLKLFDSYEPVFYIQALFAKGKSQTDVAILLDTSTKKVTTIYKEFLRLRRMQELVGLYDLISKNRNGSQAFCLIRHSGDMSQPSSRQAFYL